VHMSQRHVEAMPIHTHLPRLVAHGNIFGRFYLFTNQLQLARATARLLREESSEAALAPFIFIVTNGPDDGWVPTTAVPTVAHLRWACLHILRELHGCLEPHIETAAPFRLDAPVRQLGCHPFSQHASTDSGSVLARDESRTSRALPWQDGSAWGQQASQACCGVAEPVIRELKVDLLLAIVAQAMQSEASAARTRLRRYCKGTKGTS
jgi:hypothetical protein